VRALLDTNVLIAAFIARGNSSEVFAHCLSEHNIITSQWLIDELEEKLSGKFHFSMSEIKGVVGLVRDNAKLAEPEDFGERICRDADDDNVLAAALAGKAKCIVTGDKDLLSLKNYRGIRILSPTGFWEFEAKGG